jgi:sigma-B regulation protein RsbU (phosphoserine phosphatase)
MRSNLVRYSNGGHLPVIYLSGENSLQFLDVTEGAPLGLMEGTYAGNELSFKKGDIFILYTDGITEAMNTKSEMYGKDRLSSSIKSHREFSAKNLLTAIERDVRKFEPKSRQHDDMTLMVVKII